MPDVWSKQDPWTNPVGMVDQNGDTDDGGHVYTGPQMIKAKNPDPETMDMDNGDDEEGSESGTTSPQRAGHRSILGNVLHTGASIGMLPNIIFGNFFHSFLGADAAATAAMVTSAGLWAFGMYSTHKVIKKAEGKWSNILTLNAKRLFKGEIPVVPNLIYSISSFVGIILTPWVILTSVVAFLYAI
jgi:hypothetical protein